MRIISGMIGKKSLISLLLIMFEGSCHKKHLPDAKDTSDLANEERGEFAFAVSTAHSILKWMKMSFEDARKLVDSEGPYYSCGNELVEIPALVDGVRDPVFPAMGGQL